MLTPWGETLDREHPLSEYPRPQLRRQSYLNLNGPWEYAITQTAVRPTAMQGEIIVPFSPEAPLSGVGHILQPDEFLWYRRTVTLPPALCPQGGRLLLHFGAVDQNCTVWINNFEVGRHRGGYLPFTLDITDYLRENTLLIELCVSDPTDTAALSRGKQRLKNGGIWYTPQSGIWQTVWLEGVPQNYLRGLRITPELSTGRVYYQLEADETDGANIVVRQNGVVIAEDWADETGAAHSLIRPEYLRPWCPEDPFLYDVTITLPGGDTVQSYFGMRSFGVGPDENGVPRLLLNGKSYFHNGLLDQGYWSDGLYTAPSDEAMIHDIAEMKRLGFNMLRKHIKVEPLRWYYHCDRLGMLVWQDMVSGGGEYRFSTISFPLVTGRHHSDHNYLKFARNMAQGRAEYMAELTEMVAQLRHSPSVVLWVPFNEGWGQFDAKLVCEKLREMDPTRPIDHASGWHDQHIGLIKSLHVYFKPYRFQKDKLGRAVVLSEFGGYNLRLNGHCFNDVDFGYKKFKNPEALWTAYRKLYENEIIPAVRVGLAATVYTQLTDVEDELNGILTYDRKELKLPKDGLLHLNKYVIQQSPER